MISFLRNFLDYLQRSLWFIPLFMTFCGLFLSMGLDQLDWIFWERETPYLGHSWGLNQESMRDLFSNIGAAIITAMTTILSITLLTFTVLSGQFGAHVLRVFKIRSFSKFVMGWFSGTYLYIIYYVYRISAGNPEKYIPQLAITLGVILTATTLFLLILYVHHLVGQIQASSVISRMAEELWALIKKMEPDNHEKRIKNFSEELGLLVCSIRLEKAGYIQSIDKTQLQKIAKEHQCTVEVLIRVGNFILTGTCVIKLYSKNDFNQDLVSQIQSCFILGDKRIPVEDLECDLENLVEMTLRALSPGTNDLMIANNSIDYIAESIALLTTKKFPDTHHYNESGQLLMRSKEFSFKGFLDAALNQIRPYAVKHCSVAIRLLDSLINIARLSSSKKYYKEIARHFNAIYKAAIDEHPREFDVASLTTRKEIFLSIPHCEYSPLQ